MTTGNTIVSQFCAVLQISTWKYDFSLMTQAASVVFGYVVFGPVLLWFALKYSAVPQPLLKLMCLYGYSLTIFVPSAVSAQCHNSLLCVCSSCCHAHVPFAVVCSSCACHRTKHLIGV